MAYLLFVLLQIQAHQVIDRLPLHSVLDWAEQKHFPCIGEFTISLQSSRNSRASSFPQFRGHVHQSGKGGGIAHLGTTDSFAALGTGAHQQNSATDGDTGPLCAQTPSRPA